MGKKVKTLVSNILSERIASFLKERHDEEYTSRYMRYYDEMITMLWIEILTGEKDKYGFVEISKFKFRNLAKLKVGTRVLSDIIRSELLEIRIIETDGRYIHDSYRGMRSKCKSYKFNSDFKFEFEDLRENSYEIKITKNKTLVVDGKHKAHLSSLKQIYVDSAAAKEYIRIKLNAGGLTKRGAVFNSEKAISWYTSVFQIENKQWNFVTVPDMKRVFTNITNFPSELRKFLYFKKGVSCSIVDVKNSQPLLINALMNKEGLEDTKFKNDCESGNFYDQMLLCAPDMDRETMKVEIYKNVLFGFAVGSDVTRVFEENYPVAFDFIKRRKTGTTNGKRGNSIFAIELQDIEADICLGALSEIHESGLLALGIHDAILTSSEHSKYAESTLLKHFKRFGLNPQLSVT